MTTFYPEIILSEVISYQHNAFRERCLEIFRKKDVWEETEIEVLRKYMAKDRNYFRSSTLMLQTYVANRIDPFNKDSNALLFANLKSLMLEVNTMCSESNLNEILSGLRTELLGNHGKEEDTVDEETGEVLTYIRGNDGHLYYYDKSHVKFCTEVFFYAVTISVRQVLESYGKSFDENYLLQRVGEENSPAPTISALADPINSDEIIPIQHKIFWDEDITEFEPFFETKRITLMDESIDSSKILSILEKVFEIGEYGGLLKNERNTPVFADKPFTIPEMLRWDGTAATFAQTFSPLISLDSKTKKSQPETTLFLRFSKVGVRAPMVRVLYSLFYIVDKSGNRIAPIYLTQAFKEYGK